MSEGYGSRYDAKLDRQLEREKAPPAPALPTCEGAWRRASDICIIATKDDSPVLWATFASGVRCPVTGLTRGGWLPLHDASEVERQLAEANAESAIDDVDEFEESEEVRELGPNDYSALQSLNARMSAALAVETSGAGSMTIQRYEAGPVGTPHDSGYWVTFTDHLADKEAALAAQAERVKELERRLACALGQDKPRDSDWDNWLDRAGAEELAALRERVRGLEQEKSMRAAIARDHITQPMDGRGRGWNG